ncbi:hypothetical protein [Phytoactinopolyspora limicola]|uniref:hypothetical protein n=1 Tax=Phytoactinopolyspora limicola TaxID=2715536 RepID=UPI001408D933|nr:hypothetical protein [Phytoactinopolyspora limicola]
MQPRRAAVGLFLMPDPRAVLTLARPGVGCAARVRAAVTWKIHATSDVAPEGKG